MRAKVEYELVCSRCGLVVIAGSPRTGKVVLCKDCIQKAYNDITQTLFCPICKKTRQVKGNNKVKSKNKNCRECSLKYSTFKNKGRFNLKI